MTTLRAAAQQALEALVAMNPSGPTGSPIWHQQMEAITAIQAALAEPVQEPVAWLHTDAYNPRVRFLEWAREAKGYRGDWIKTPLYTAPQQRLPLTEEEIERLWYPSAVMAEPGKRRVAFGRAIEQAHGIGSKT